jgi:hypothetical protein
VYVSFKPTDVNMKNATDSLIRCMADIRRWMDANFLKLNEGKTELIMFGSPQQLRKTSFTGLTIGDASISPSSVVRNLGAYLDSNMTMSAHIGKVCSSAYLQLRNISRIRPFLTQKTTEQMVHAFITSRLDMGNALLYRLPQTQLGRLQRIQISAARLVTRSPRREYITPVLYRLNWLPVEQRIQFKILLQVYRAVNDNNPVYLSELLHVYKPTRQLRSGSAPGALLVVPRTQTVWGDRSFCKAAPQLWNSLPCGLRLANCITSFKCALKTPF